MFTLSNRTEIQNKHSQPFYRELINYFGEDIVRKGVFMESISNIRDHWTNEQKTVKIIYDFYKTPYFWVNLIDKEGHGISSHTASTLRGAMDLANKSLFSRAYHSQPEDN